MLKHFNYFLQFLITMFDHVLLNINHENLRVSYAILGIIEYNVYIINSI